MLEGKSKEIISGGKVRGQRDISSADIDDLDEEEKSLELPMARETVIFNAQEFLILRELNGGL